MQLLTPRDMRSCRVGQGKYVLIVDEAGGILNDPVLLRLEENRFWIALADSDILLWAKGVARGSGLDVKISEPDASPLQVQGPKSKALMEDLFGEKVMDLPYYFFTPAELDGIPLLVTRTGWTGEIGYALYLLDRTRGKEIGRVPSAIHSPRLKKNIGYAMVPIAFSDLGTEVEVIHPSGTRKARVVKKPFIDPGKAIPKA